MDEHRELKPKDISQSERPYYDANGRLSRTVILTFFVGDHGPFIRQFTADEATPEKLRTVIQDKVSELRQLLTLQS